MGMETLKHVQELNVYTSWVNGKDSWARGHGKFVILWLDASLSYESIKYSNYCHIKQRV